MTGWHSTQHHIPIPTFYVLSPTDGWMIMGTLSTLAAPDVTDAASSAFTVMLGFAGLVFPCGAFAWDGLVRRHALIWSFPVGATLGQQAASITRLRAVVLGVVSALLGVFLLGLAVEFYRVALLRQCPGHASLACVGALTASVPWAGWLWFGICTGWFVFVWLRIGDPRKRVLVSGVWYQQDRAAGVVNRRLRAQGLLPLAPERLYQIEGVLVRWLNQHGWLGPGVTGPGYGLPPAAWPQGAAEAQEVAEPDVVLTAVEGERVYLAADETQRAALRILIPYFLDLARRGERKSALARWWARTGQLARLGIYGRRTL